MNTIYLEFFQQLSVQQIFIEHLPCAENELKSIISFQHHMKPMKEIIIVIFHIL